MRLAALEKLTTDEAKSGECTAEHRTVLDKAVSDFETAAKQKNGEDGKPLALQTVAKKVLSLGDSARGVELSVTGRGTELHVVAFAVRDVSMDVLAGNSAASTLRSPLQKDLPVRLTVAGGPADVMSDSRQLVIKPGQPLQVKLTGKGCSAMLALIAP